MAANVAGLIVDMANNMVVSFELLGGESYADMCIEVNNVLR